MSEKPTIYHTVLLLHSVDHVRDTFDFQKKRFFKTGNHQTKPLANYPTRWILVFKPALQQLLKHYKAQETKSILTGNEY